MLRLFYAALPLVARVALAAPTVAERCQDPEQHPGPLSSPVSSGPASSLPFGSEPLDTEPIVLDHFASQSSHPEPLAPNPFHLGSDAESHTPPLSDPLLSVPTSEPFSSPASSSAGNDTPSQSEARPPLFKSGNAGTNYEQSSRKRPQGKKKNVVYFTNW